MRVITFSMYYPAYHPRKGEDTWFVEKILNGLTNKDLNKASEIFPTLNDFAFALEQPKFHTIRAGNRWKVGDKFSARVWSDKPYRSKQLEIAPPIEIKKIWNFEVRNGSFYFDTCDYGSFCEESTELNEIAANDGLSTKDFIHWFNKPFSGQIICWNKHINYETEHS